MGVRVGTRYLPPVRILSLARSKGPSVLHTHCTHWTYQTWPIFPGTQFLAGWHSKANRGSSYPEGISNYPLTGQKKYEKHSWSHFLLLLPSFTLFIFAEYCRIL